VLICLISIEGVSVRRETTNYERALPSIQAEVERNLAAVSKDQRWTPVFRWFPYPKLIGARCGGYCGGPRIDVYLTNSVKIRSAKMCVLDVIAARSTKADIIQKLKKYSVNDKMLQNLTGNNTSWESHQGKYSLVFIDY
jgi:hypothetical protein